MVFGDFNHTGKAFPFSIQFTQNILHSRTKREDHPHIHGEHFTSSILLPISLGSPPYTWGAHVPLAEWSNRDGITPIYMGSTWPDSLDTIKQWDHPHIHGEHKEIDMLKDTLTGSPPYTWGARRLALVGCPSLGITPIYMGSTHARPYLHPDVRDHPHIHGEHTTRPARCRRLWGSPPYTWGAQTVLFRSHHACRITPIYMGSTCQKISRSVLLTDHPHIHGEHSPLAAFMIVAVGSPPYTWGAPILNAYFDQ